MRVWFVKQGQNVGDDFVIAWGWDNDGSSFNDRRTQLMLDGVINILGDPSTDSYYLNPPPNSPYGAAFRYDTPEQREILLDTLESQSSGNFFWFGHGSATSFQGNGKKSQMDVDTIENRLYNKKHRSTKYNFPNKHPYRLVILNGCKMYSPEWAHAFGFDFSPKGTTNDVLAYVRQGRQPQAFVGWTKAISVPFDFSVNDHINYSEGLAYLTSLWMQGYALEACLQQYQATMASHGFNDHETWKISGTSVLYRGAP